MSLTNRMTAAFAAVALLAAACGGGVDEAAGTNQVPTATAAETTPSSEPAPTTEAAVDETVETEALTEVAVDSCPDGDSCRGDAFSAGRAVDALSSMYDRWAPYI